MKGNQAFSERKSSDQFFSQHRWLHTMDTFLRLSTVSALWVSWCVIHSLLNSEGPIGRTQVVRGAIGRFYRLFYNIFAVASLVLVLYEIPHENEVTIVKWRGPLVIVQGVIWAFALFILYASSRLRGAGSFSGLDALRSKHTEHADQQLVTWSIYGVIRHPGFFAGLILLWTRDLTDTDLVTNAVLSLYLIVGSKIEERRLLKKYGNQYREYMSRVPSFLPTSLSALRAVVGRSDR